MNAEHNSSDLAPQRQEMSVENVSLGLVPQGQKASDYDNSDPVPPRQNVVPIAEKTDSSQQGLEFLFSPLLEEYYNPTHGLAEENNNDQAPNASVHQDDFFNPFCTRVQEIGESSVQEIGESSSRNIDNTDVHSFQPQSHDYRWTRDHPLEQVYGNPTMPVQTRRQLATYPEMLMIAAHGEYVETLLAWEAVSDFPSYAATSLFQSSQMDVKNGFLNDADHADALILGKHFWSDTVPGDKLGKLECQRNKIAQQCLQQKAETEYQLADMFTKALPEDRFKYLVRRIGMRCLTPADLEVLTNETA
ncbi:hypothetical protein Tco_1265758 [Tanacetum coccineum]